jgi:hypothetical protein
VDDHHLGLVDHPIEHQHRVCVFGGAHGEGTLGARSARARRALGEANFIRALKTTKTD